MHACKKCGHPLPEDLTQPCPECGTKHEVLIRFRSPDRASRGLRSRLPIVLRLWVWGNVAVGALIISSMIWYINTIEELRRSIDRSLFYEFGVASQTVPDSIVTRRLAALTGESLVGPTTGFAPLVPLCAAVLVALILVFKGLAVLKANERT